MGKRRVLPLLLAALMLLSAFPAAAAESVTAATMQLMKTEGTVNVTNSSGRGLSVRDNMRLYNGYHVETKAKSYAWINLDSTKLIKLDAVSEGEVRKSGKALELLLSSGGFFFNVTSPLKEDETLNVRTTTMVVGIRGTSGWFKAVDRWSTEIYVLEGTVQCSVSDPVTGQAKKATIQSGEMAVATAYPQDYAGDKCDIVQERFEPGDIDGFVLEELARDPALCADILEKSGLDVLSAVEATQERREQDEQKMQEALDRIENQLTEQNNNTSTGPVWDQNSSAPSAPSTPPTTPSNGGTDGDSGNDGDSGGGPDVPPVETPPADNPPADNPPADNPPADNPPAENPTSPGTRIILPTLDELKKSLKEDDIKEIILSASDNPDENILTIPSGEILTLPDGVDVTVQDDVFLIIKGTVIGEGNNTLTILDGAEIDINSSGVLDLQSIENNGTLINEESGQIITDSLTTAFMFSNAGSVEGAITQTDGDTELITTGIITGDILVSDHGTFNMNGGTITGDISVSGNGAFNMDGGTITGDITLSNGGSFTMDNGTITGRVSADDDSAFTQNGGEIKNVADDGPDPTEDNETINGEEGGLVPGKGEEYEA